jgi:Queuosine biosynthesis protein QueC
MTAVVVHPDLTKLPAPQSNVIPVHLYGGVPRKRGMTAIGLSLYNRLARVNAPIDPVAFDFLSLSMAVTASDTFVDRDDAADGWARDIQLTVALVDPARWIPVLPMLTSALNFLSGDIWSIKLIGGGEPPPVYKVRTRLPINLNRCDCACLFSGGLDSAIGVLDLLKQGRNPILVSHAYTHDASRQIEILPKLGPGLVRFGAQANPSGWLEVGNDVQMRTRSFNFLAMGVLMASALVGFGANRRPLFVPENGLIALNPPLTSRRIGALSTRTTHPYYLSLMQKILDKVGLLVDIENPYAGKTKGEMMKGCLDQVRLKQIADRTVSCGKWKRKRTQCGRCVPCLIRRAAYHGAGMKDGTDYQPEGQVLQHFLEYGADSDDLMAMLLAVKRLPNTDFNKWIAQTGPMPLPANDINSRVDAVRRGMIEVENYLRSQVTF